MENCAHTERTRRHLFRLVALLCALAGLAERAAGRPGAVQRLVMWLLRWGEAVARDHVFALTGCTAFGHAPTALLRAGTDEAQRLAERFRALAAILSAFAVAMSCIPGRRRTVISGPAAAGGIAVSEQVARPAERLDSS